jgi:putative sterol carrier protein
MHSPQYGWRCHGADNPIKDGQVTVTKFPSAEWLDALHLKLNTDGHYGVIARDWEGDLYFEIQPDAPVSRTVTMYLDLWHGKCRGVAYDAPLDPLRRPRFVLRSSYRNFTAVLLGEMNPMTAMMTSKLKVDGDLGYMMRHVPTVLDFVRCAREITTDVR